jgi:hypothetical protein
MTSPVDASAAEARLSEPATLTQLVMRARSGLRSDVAAFLAGCQDAQLLVPLKRALSQVAAGERVAFDGNLEISPHLVPTTEQRAAVAFFTEMAALEPAVRGLGWRTDGQPLQLCGLPALTALKLAYRMIDNWNIMSLVIDASMPSELWLSPTELSSLLDGKPLPLIKYTAGQRPDQWLGTVQPASAELVKAAQICMASESNVLDHRIEWLFDPERHLSPRLTITVYAKPGADREAITSRIGRALASHLPGGSANVHFEDRDTEDQR